MTISNGGKNLIRLGLGAILIATITSGVSLYVYHSSGDIYLDRSRPGFLPEKSEIENNDTPSDYKIPETGDIDQSVIDELLDNFDQQAKRLESFDDPFSADALSDEALGIISE